MDRQTDPTRLTGTPKGKGTLGKFRHKWEDNIITELKEIGASTIIVLIIGFIKEPF